MGLAPYGEPKYAKLIRDNLIDLKPDGSFRLNLAILRVLHRPAHDERQVRRAVRRPAESPGSSLTQREMDIAASIQLVTEEVVVRLVEDVVKSRRAQSLPGGRRCAQLRGQRPRAALRQGRSSLDPAGGRRCGRCRRGGAGGLSSLPRQAAQRAQFAPAATDSMACRGACSGPPSTRTRSRKGCMPAGARYEVLVEDALIAATADALSPRRRWAGSRGAWSSVRVRSARAPSWATRARPTCRAPQPEDQVPRVVPPVRAVGALRGRGRVVRAGRRTVPTCCWWPTSAEKRRLAMTEAQKALFGIDKLNVPRSEIPAVTHVDYSARVQTVHRETNPRFHELLTAVSRAHGVPGAGQHQLQRTRRAHRVHARRRLPLLHGHRARRARHRQLSPQEGAAAARR